MSNISRPEHTSMLSQCQSVPASVPPRRIEDDWVCCRPLIGEEDPTSKFRVERPAGQKPV